jgi:SAM-dependent methyltransferase
MPRRCDFRHLDVTQLPPHLYDLAQVALGMGTSLARLAPHFAKLHNGSVLDVGGGTGLYARYLPESVRYLCLDNDLAKLRRAKAVLPRLMRCDATRIALAPKSVDYALCIGVAHHLADRAFEGALREIARVVRHRMIFVDPVAQRRLSLGGLLWMLDDGNYPRSEKQLLDALSHDFVCEQVESYRIYHRYLICVGSPRIG